MRCPSQHFISEEARLPRKLARGIEFSPDVGAYFSSWIAVGFDLAKWRKPDIKQVCQQGDVYFFLAFEIIQ